MRVNLTDIQFFTSLSVVIFGFFDVAVGHRQLTNFLCVEISNETQNRNYMDSTAITFDQLPHVVGGLSEKLDSIILVSEDPTFSTELVVLTDTKGILNLPDNVSYWVTSKPTKEMTTSSNTSGTLSNS